MSQRAKRKLDSINLETLKTDAPKAIRAVASSCTHCWLSFAVPCHRVLHKSGAQQARRDPRASRRLRWVDYEAKLPAGQR